MLKNYLPSNKKQYVKSNEKKCRLPARYPPSLDFPGNSVAFPCRFLFG